MERLIILSILKKFGWRIDVKELPLENAIEVTNTCLMDGNYRVKKYIKSFGLEPIFLGGNTYRVKFNLKS